MEKKKEEAAKKVDEENAKEAVADLRAERPAAATPQEGAKNAEKSLKDFFNRFRG